MQRSAYPLLLLTMLFWGGNAIAGKLAVGHVSPMVLTAMRWGLAFAALTIVGGGQLRRDWMLARVKLPLLAALGFAGFTLFNVALYSALEFTTAINTSIEQAGMPMLIFAANFALFRTALGAGQIVGFLLSVFGVLLTASHGDPLKLVALDLNTGDALMVGACLVYAGYTVALRWRPDIHWMSLMILMTGAAFVTALPFAAWEIFSGRAIWPDGEGWMVVAYTAIFPSIVSQVFYIKGVALIGGNRAGLFINLVPIFGTLLSIMILRETFHAYHAMAILLTLGGIGLAEWSGRRMAKTLPRLS